MPNLLAKQAEIVFLALPHGVAAEFAVPLLQAGCLVIDLSADFRLKSAAVYKEFYAHDHPAPELLAKSVYGLPEIYRSAIKDASLIASPGCYPTSILLPMIPLLRAGLIKPHGHHRRFAERRERRGAQGRTRITCLSSATKASGPTACRSTGICRKSNRNFRSLPARRSSIQFTPHLIPVNRGILTTLYLAPEKHFGTAAEMKALSEQISACYQQAYGNEPFVRLLEGKALPDTKNVVGTNVIEIAWRLDPRTGRLIVMSAEDNLVKGASGQAVQSMNILCGFPETAGLI